MAATERPTLDDSEFWFIERCSNLNGTFAHDYQQYRKYIQNMPLQSGNCEQANEIVEALKKLTVIAYGYGGYFTEDDVAFIFEHLEMTPAFPSVISFASDRRRRLMPVSYLASLRSDPATIRYREILGIERRNK